MLQAFGIFVLIIFPILAFLFSWYGIVKYPGKWRIFLPFYCYSIFIFAYSITPNSDSNYDLIRYFQQLDDLTGLSLPEAIKYFNDNLFLENILFWSISQLKLPHLLPAITTCTVCSIGGYIACDSAEPGSERNIWRVLLVQFLMIPIVTTAYNVRNVFAFSLGVMAAYRELKQKKRDYITLLLYIAPFFIHKTGIIMFAIRLCIPVFKKYRVWALALIFSLPILITGAFRYVAYIPRGGILGKIIVRLIYSANSYLRGESEYAERIQNSLGAAVNRYVVFLFISVIIVFFVVYFREEKEPDLFFIFAYLLSIFTLACNVIVTPAYWRFAVAAELSCPVILHKLYSGDLFGKKMTYYVRWGLIAYMAMRVSLQVVRGSFFYNYETYYLFFTTNAITLFYQIVKQLLLL